MPQRQKTILIAGDDPESLAHLRTLLGTQFEVQIATSGSADGPHEEPAIILLDLFQLTDGGLGTVTLLRGKYPHVPILLLSGGDEFELSLRAFELGVDDVIQKPFRPRELVARISSNLKRIEERLRSTSLLARGNLELNIETFEVRVGDDVVALSVLEFNLLRHFLENIERVLTREQILRAVWGDDIVVTSRTVDTHMTSLRKKLKNCTLRFMTLYGAGYIFKDAGAAPRSGSAALPDPL